jgi:hypothetical protein
MKFSPAACGGQAELLVLLGRQVDDDEPVDARLLGLGQEPVDPAGIDRVVVAHEHDGRLGVVLAERPHHVERAVHRLPALERALPGALDRRAVGHRIGEGHAQLDDVDAGGRQAPSGRERGLGVGVTRHHERRRRPCGLLPSAQAGEGGVDAAHGRILRTTTGCLPEDMTDFNARGRAGACTGTLPPQPAIPSLKGHELCPCPVPAAPVDLPDRPGDPVDHRLPDLGARDPLLGRADPSDVRPARLDHHLPGARGPARPPWASNGDRRAAERRQVDAVQRADAHRAAQAANFPFCTIEPNVGEVAVPDERLDKLAAIAKSRRSSRRADLRRHRRAGEGRVEGRGARQPVPRQHPRMRRHRPRAALLRGRRRHPCRGPGRPGRRRRDHRDRADAGRPRQPREALAGLEKQGQGRRQGGEEQDRCWNRAKAGARAAGEARAHGRGRRGGQRPGGCSAADRQARALRLQRRGGRGDRQRLPRKVEDGRPPRAPAAWSSRPRSRRRSPSSPTRARPSSSNRWASRSPASTG